MSPEDVLIDWKRKRDIYTLELSAERVSLSQATAVVHVVRLVN